MDSNQGTSQGGERGGSRPEWGAYPPADTGDPGHPAGHPNGDKRSRRLLRDSVRTVTSRLGDVRRHGIQPLLDASVQHSSLPYPGNQSRI